MVDGAYFAYVGGRADAEDFARRFSRGAWETLDLQGCFVMPGFNDSHLHFTTMSKQSCPSTSSAVPLWRRCRSACAGGWPGWRPAPAAGFWARGGTRSSSPASGVFPPPGAGQVSTEYPILILRSCFHVGALNSRALELLHINRDTVGHYGAFAEVDETGAPNGVVKENVLDDIKAAHPLRGPESPEWSR